MKKVTLGWRSFVAGAALASAVLLGAMPAQALPPGEIGSWASWAAGSSSAPYSVSASFASSSAMPALTVTSDASTVSPASGASAFLGSSTGPGAEYGSSRLQPYLSVSTAPGLAASTTNLTFAGAPGSQWSFVLGDVDADWVAVSSYDADGNLLTGAGDLSSLGFHGAGNYCGGSPKPSGCGTGAHVDAPTWITAPTTIAATCLGISTSHNYVPGTLRGNVADTSGAYGWFTPTANVARIELVFGSQCGFPSYQLWTVAGAPLATITGVIQIPTEPPGTPVPDGIVATLNDNASAPVKDLLGDPVTVPVATDGTFQFEVPQSSIPYQISFETPAGVEPIATIPAPANTATPVALVVSAAIVNPTPAGPELAASGTDVRIAPFALVTIGAGAMLLAFARRRSRRTR